MILDAQINTGAPQAKPAPDKLALLLLWLGELIQEHGAGEYIVTVKQDGAVTVKRPRKPLEFHYGG